MKTEATLVSSRKSEKIRWTGWEAVAWALYLGHRIIIWNTLSVTFVLHT